MATIDDSTRQLADYIIGFQRHCDRYVAPLADPQGKSVLVVGCGHGTEMLWCIQNGATEVIGIDVAPRSTAALELALDKLEVASPPPFELLTLPVEEVANLGRSFDLVVSNNVFEHLPDIDSAFVELRRVVRPMDGRLAIFTDPLYYSSHGAHLKISPWEHLMEANEELERRAASRYEWHEYVALNRMTLTHFLSSVRDAGYVILQLFVVPDRSLNELPSQMPRIPQGISVTDLALEGIGIELMTLNNSSATATSASLNDHPPLPPRR